MCVCVLQVTAKVEDACQTRRLTTLFMDVESLSDKNINQEAVGLPDVFLPQYRLCWLALFGVQSVHSQMDRTVFA